MPVARRGEGRTQSQGQRCAARVERQAAAGRRILRLGRSRLLPTLLHEGPYELLSVRLQRVIDLVEKTVERIGTFGLSRCRHGLRGVVFVAVA